MPLKFTHQAMKIISHSALYVFAQELSFTLLRSIAYQGELSLYASCDETENATST